MRIFYISILFLIFSSVASGQTGTDSNAFKSKGTWIDPIDKISRIDTIGPCNYPCRQPSYFIRICTDSPLLARFIQPGEVSLITAIGDDYAVIVKMDKDKFLTYSGFKSMFPKKGDKVIIGQVIGPLIEANEGVYELEIGFWYKGKIERRIQDWFNPGFRKRARLMQ